MVPCIKHSLGNILFIFGGFMIDINLIRENKELVKENIKKKFQDEKLGLVDEVYE